MTHGRDVMDTLVWRGKVMWESPSRKTGENYHVWIVIHSSALSFDILSMGFITHLKQLKVSCLSLTPRRLL